MTAKASRGIAVTSASVSSTGSVRGSVTVTTGRCAPGSSTPRGCWAARSPRQVVCGWPQRLSDRRRRDHRVEGIERGAETPGSRGGHSSDANSHNPRYPVTSRLGPSRRQGSRHARRVGTTAICAQEKSGRKSAAHERRNVDVIVVVTSADTDRRAVRVHQGSSSSRSDRTATKKPCRPVRPR